MYMYTLLYIYIYIYIYKEIDFFVEYKNITANRKWQTAWTENQCLLQLGRQYTPKLRAHVYII